AERAPRKRRRRRGGRKIDGADGSGANAEPKSAAAPSSPKPQANPQAKPRQPRTASGTKLPSSKAAASQKTASPSLMSRIGLGLKKLVTRAPRSQH
ncbi:MAG: ATP-dependent RNA helicase RhlB, partial [Pseudomonadota bacterium]|nr:ATP-dependent RNA helicase RhlB [Pseudomonadota bacterium]